MQNRYACDIGDFGKYGLLKRLCIPADREDGPALKLGVMWYLVPDESHSEDGKYISYLNPTPKNLKSFKNCDPVLHDKLAHIIEEGDRNIIAIRQNQVLPDDTVYFEEPLRFDQCPSTRQAKLVHRKTWLDSGLKLTKDCDIVFFDPDNGLEVKVERHMKKGPKYVYIDELKPFFERGQSLVIYHHLCRTGTAQEQIKGRLEQLDKHLSGMSNSFCMLYKRGTLRAFFVIPSQDDAFLLRRRASGMTKPPWSEHFELKENLQTNCYRESLDVGCDKTTLLSKTPKGCHPESGTIQE